MAKTDSNDIHLASTAPSFQLLEPLTDQRRTLDELRGALGTVIVFMCNHCPYVTHLIDHLAKTAQEYQTSQIQFIGINSNDVETYPDDNPEHMIQFAKDRALPFPYLFDASQSVAKAYDAACTPDIYVYNSELELFYHGQYDHSRPGQDIALSGHDLKHALERLIHKQPAPEQQHPCQGCNIKWK